MRSKIKIQENPSRIKINQIRETRAPRATSERLVREGGGYLANLFID